MKSFFKTYLAFLLLIFLTFVLNSCGEKTDINNLMLYIADDYSDFMGRRRSGTRTMIEGYFQQYRGIAVNMLSTQIDDISEHEAGVQTEVALSSGAAKVFRKLVRVSTDNYRIKMKLRKKEGRWQILYAKWRYISLDELYPESLKILKKIFPDF